MLFLLLVLSSSQLLRMGLYTESPGYGTPKKVASGHGDAHNHGSLGKHLSVSLQWFVCVYSGATVIEWMEHISPGEHNP